MAKIDLSQAPWMECDCGSKMFKPVAVIKKISALIAPDGQERLVPLDLYACVKCDKIPTFMHETITGFPDELKAIKPLS